MAELTFHPPFVPRRGKMASLAYAKAYNKSRHAHPSQRAAGREELEAARAQLTRVETSIMDMVAGRGAMMAGVARITGQRPEDLWKAYLSACDKLATHYGFRN